MARVTPDSISDGHHAGVCDVCGGESHAAWSPSPELCRACIVRILPAMLVDALEMCDRATIYQHREMVQTSYWRAAFARLERETADRTGGVAQ